MSLAIKPNLKPRKTPLQARSSVTLDAIYDAAIQVLLVVGAKHITTTRVAERAGVSVGTLYQYHANIQSLMVAVLDRHLREVVDIVAQACLSAHSKQLNEMVRALVNAFIDSKVKDADVARALYGVALDMNCAAMVRNASNKLRRATEAMLLTMSDYEISDVKSAAAIIVLAKTGPVKSMLEAGASPKMIQEMRKHLFLLCSGYLEKLAMPKRQKR